MDESKTTEPAYWRIVPKRNAPSHFVRKFKSQHEATEMLTAMRKRNTYKVAAYDRHDKRCEAS